jgi:large subunit ribosomal protein L30
MTKLKITQVKSTIGGLKNQKATLHTLGLRKIGQSVTRVDDSQLRGQLRTVAHLVDVEEVD